MPYINVWIHLVWTTKNRHPFLIKDIRPQVFAHIKENAKTKGIYLDHINGYTEHVHCLISLHANQNIATIAGMLKGESSHWINKNKLTKTKFGWQDEYYAGSVGYSQVDMVRQYIRNQEKHHQKTTFQEEFNEFINHFGLKQG